MDSQGEYEKVKHVKPKLVASTPSEKRKTVEEAFLDKVLSSDPKINKAKQYFSEAESSYNDAVRVRQSANGSHAQLKKAAELFMQAGRRYEEAGGYWPESALQEDASFMAAECYFYIDYYKHANQIYKEMLKEYPNTRHLDKIQAKRFQIARYWLDEDFKDKQDSLTSILLISRCHSTLASPKQSLFWTRSAMMIRPVKWLMTPLC